ncbi:hypothetical protein PGB90_009375 [Kerria lacca]
MNFWYPQTYFIDKSMVIKVFLKCRHKFIIVSAPQGFLKTSNMQMIASFLAISTDQNYIQQRKHQLHELKIGKETRLINRYFGRHPVLFLNFGLPNCVRNIYSMVDFFRKIYEQHIFLLNSPLLSSAQKTNFKIYLNYRNEYIGVSETKLADALKTLCELLFVHYRKKVFLFIDNYDYPLLECINKDTPLHNIQPFLGKMMTKIHKSVAVRKIFLTGLTGLTGTNKGNFKIYRFLHNHSFSKYYGLTENDVYHIANNVRCSTEIINEILSKEYRTVQNLKIYSPEWVHDFLKYKFIENEMYFADIFNKPVLHNALMKNLIQKLLQGRKLKIMSRKFNLQMDVLDLNRLMNGNAEELELDEIELILSFLFEFGLFTFVTKNWKESIFDLLTRKPKLTVILNNTCRAVSHLIKNFNNAL